MPDVQFITVLGAAGVALWVIWLIVGGKLHSDSEVQNLKIEIVGHKEDKKELLQENKDLRNIQAEVAPLLREILDILRLDEEEAP